jgi:predicted nucleic acid-binding protein
MTTGAADPTFIDTNILVFASAITAPFHALARQAILALEAVGVELWVSRQVLREYLATFTRPQTYTAPRPVPFLVSDVRSFERRFRVAEDRPEVTTNLLSLLDQIAVGGKQVHDANIVATMQAYGIPRLLTNNDADFARYAGLITVVPLVPAR